MPSPKTKPSGQPTTDPRRHTLSIRLTDGEYRALRQLQETELGTLSAARVIGHLIVQAAREIRV